MNGALRGGQHPTSALQGGCDPAPFSELAGRIITDNPLVTPAAVSAPPGGGDAFGDLDDIYDDWSIMDFR